MDQPDARKIPALAPHTTTLPDGSDAIVMEGSGPFKVNYIDLRGGRKAEDWQPVGVKVENTPGIGPPEQRVAEQDVDGLLAEVLFPNMAAGPGLWRNMQDDAAYKAAVRAYNDWLAEESARRRRTASSAWRSCRGPILTTPWRN